MNRKAKARAYKPSAVVCPMCGHNAVMRMFRCRCSNWYGWYALRFYCKDDGCPVIEVCTLFFPDAESAEKEMEKRMVKKRGKRK